MPPPPLRPPASRSASSTSSRGSNEDHDGAIDAQLPQQSGRSAIHLAAQRSAQSLREASRPAQRRPNSSYAAPSASLTENLAPLRTARRHSTFVPNVPSPLNPTIAAYSSAPASRKASKEGVNGSHPPDLKLSDLEKGIPTRPPPAPPTRLLSAPHPALADRPPRLYAPTSVRDLGSDYTRYFDPYLIVRPTIDRKPPSRRRSITLTTQDSGDNGSQRATSTRASDPFGDVKRIPSPSDIGSETTAGAELRGDASSTDEKNKSALAASPASQSPPSSSSGSMDSSEQEKFPFFQYLDDRLGAPEHSFPLITDQKEDDDEMHMPQWDDDVRLKPKFRDHFNRESFVSTLGLIMMVCGLLFAFVVLPIISYTGTGLLDLPQTPLSEFPGHYPPSQPWAWVNDRKYPLLQNVRQGLIDPDTPASAMTRTGVNGDEFTLVFSDEFNKKGRTFYPGDDAYWTGFDGWYGATQDLEWYDPDALITGNGSFLITMDQFQNHNLNFRSGMLNSWNQLCFKGGIFEVSVSLPGPAGVHGLWPGIWTMGNLGRPGYLATTDGLWPYTYNDCDAGITPNQSSTDGLSNLPGQRLNSCTCPGQDHPNPGTGRGAPEIDIAEVSATWGSGPGWGVATQSYQVAPFDIWYYPNYHFMQNPDRNLSLVNSWVGGPYQQAVSTTTMLNNNWYDGKEFQKFAYEYVPGDDENAYVAWTISDAEMMRFDARAIGPNGNIGQRLISQEPMSVIMNVGISNSWVSIDWADLKFPTTMAIDYVRWYQKADEQMVTCDPPGYETTEYIAAHPKAYRNQNATKWHETGYSWPTNSFVDGCGS